MSPIQRIASPVLVALSLWMTGACDNERGSTPPPTPTPTPTARSAEPQPRESPPAAQPSPDLGSATATREEIRATLRSLYRARHVEDLPSRQVIESHPGGEAAVRWLAEHDDTMVVRARALASLHMFPNAESERVLRSVLTTGHGHRTLRSAALRALKGWDLSQRDDLRALAIDGLQSDEVPVAIAAAQVLADVPEASSALQRRLSQKPPPALERAIRSSR